MATVLISTQEKCRMCGKALAVDPNFHVVVIYHEQRGSYLGSRVTKINAVALARSMNIMVTGHRMESGNLMTIVWPTNSCCLRKVISKQFKFNSPVQS